MYYSENGIAGEPQYRACGRSSLFSGAVDSNTLREQSRSFAYLFNNQTKDIDSGSIDLDPSSFFRLVDEAHQRMFSVTGRLNI